MADGEGLDKASEFNTNKILAIINEFRTMRKYFEDTTRIDSFIDEFQSMLKYATA